MTIGIITIYNSFLYYCSLIFLTTFILNNTPRKGILIGSFAVFIPLIILSLPNIECFLYPAYLAFEVLQFFLLKLSFKTVKLRQLLFSYVFLYCLNMIITSLIVPFIPHLYNYVDVTINSLTAILCIIACLTSLRYKIQHILAWTPKYIMVVSAILLAVAATISVIVSFFANSRFPEILISWLPVVTSFLLMIICVVVPIIFIISISNTRLKTLTADYEQQIHAQAEHYKKLAEANYEVRRFRHDFQNVRIAMATLLEQGDYEQAKLLIVQSGDAMDSMQPLFSTGNGIADALLTDKQARADAINTSITFSGVIPPDSLSPTDLCVLLGNSLDNALDACRKLPLRDRKVISVNSNCAGGFLFLTIRNPIGERVTIRNNHIATTKADKTLHGYGLYSLHTIVKRYDGQIQLNATDDSFTVSIDLSVPVKH